MIHAQILTESQNLMHDQLSMASGKNQQPLAAPAGIIHAEILADSNNSANTDETLEENDETKRKNTNLDNVETEKKIINLRRNICKSLCTGHGHQKCISQL